MTGRIAMAAWFLVASAQVARARDPGENRCVLTCPTVTLLGNLSVTGTYSASNGCTSTSGSAVSRLAYWTNSSRNLTGSAKLTWSDSTATFTIGDGASGNSTGIIRADASSTPELDLAQAGSTQCKLLFDGTNVILSTTGGFVLGDASLSELMSVSSAGNINAAGTITQGNTHFNVNTSGVIATYKSVAKDTNHNGVPFTTVSTSATGQTANITGTNLVASATAGRYRMCCYEGVTTAASISSTIPDCNLICTDPTDSVAKTMAVANGNLFPAVTNPGTGVAISGCGICNAKSATAIQYSTSNYASNAAGMTYDLYITLEAM